MDFVLSKIALSVGTRAESIQAPVAYEIPKEVVTEAIVNAVAHRDYTDNSSVQVMLFADRLEVMNSGRLQPPLTVEKLRVAHPSLPGNPLLAESMYLLRYIERMGTGTVDMIRRCVDAGLAEPEFDANGGFVTRIERGGAGPDGAPLSGSTQETTQEDRGTTQETTQERILALLREDPGLTRRALATRIGITADGVKYHLDKLRNAGRIRHVGATKKGHWEILNDG